MLRPAAAGTLKTAGFPLTLGYGGGQTTSSARPRRAATHAQDHAARAAPPRGPAASATPCRTRPVNIAEASIGLHTSGGNASSWTTLPWHSATPSTRSGRLTCPRRGRERMWPCATPGRATGRCSSTWAPAGPTAEDSTPPLFAWLELEVPASTPVVAAFGDSSSGVSSSRPVVDSVHRPVRPADRRGPDAHWSHTTPATRPRAGRARSSASGSCVSAERDRRARCGGLLHGI